VPKTELVETTKWGIQFMFLNSKNVIGIRFKEIIFKDLVCGIIFLKGEKEIFSQCEGVTKLYGQWRFNVSKKSTKKEVNIFRSYVMRN
jgi:hypothetical protein